VAEKIVEFKASGRRRTSVAHVRLARGVGKIEVNRSAFEAYFPVEAVRNFILQPLELTQKTGQFDVLVSCKGGGKVGQAGALRQGLARALMAADENLRAPLKAAGCLTRDSRMKERKKPGQPGARKRYQFSKR